ncbi:hypothetical protein AB6A40_004710 [Gnathostoma spinigerum]|uniref:type I protein arginine methyltransferase n=1 Tax=Gnathostoma spinigerum TaxID=75299 RepID=A0ABD6EFL4_9BILA
MTSRSYGRARLIQVADDTEGFSLKKQCCVDVSISGDQQFVCCTDVSGTEVYKFPICSTCGVAISSKTFALGWKDCWTNYNDSVILSFGSSKEMREFVTAFNLCQSIKPSCQSPAETQNEDNCLSTFDARTEKASASQYFQFYGYLAQQQNMMQDYVRTSTYQRAMHANSRDFKDKVVLDVGAGSGILSFFAVQAGARKVYAVEASSMAIHCAELVRTNGLSDKIVVVAGRIEEVEIPEQVDIIISEPMGYMLVNERMLESYIYARKFLKPHGRMFPTTASLHLALFNDEALFIEQNAKANFWCQDSFHGVNLSHLRPQALTETLKQPVVDTWHVNSLMTGSVKWCINFEKDSEQSLHTINIPFDFVATKAGYVHGIAFWFDVAFVGSSETVWLSTAPTEPLTHWYQVRCLFDRPLMVFIGQHIRGDVSMVANERQSYDVELYADASGQISKNSLDLKNPLFRYTGAAVLPPSGSNNESPSDALLQTSGHVGDPMDVQMPVGSGMNGLVSSYNGAGPVSGTPQMFAQNVNMVVNGNIHSHGHAPNTDIIDMIAQSHAQLGAQSFQKERLES